MISPRLHTIDECEAIVRLARTVWRNKAHVAGSVGNRWVSPKTRASEGFCDTFGEQIYGQIGINMSKNTNTGQKIQKCHWLVLKTRSQRTRAEAGRFRSNFGLMANEKRVYNTELLSTVQTQFVGPHGGHQRGTEGL